MSRIVGPSRTLSSQRACKTGAILAKRYDQ